MTAAGIGLAAGLFQALGYLIYFRQAVRAECRPNGLTWVMWAYGALAFVAIEAHLGAPWPVLALPAMCMACSAAVACYAFSTGVHVRAERQDWAALGVDVALTLGYVVLALWSLHVRRDVDAMSLAFVALAGGGTAASSWPILRTTYLEPGNERPLAWFVWSAAYGLLGLAVMFEGLNWVFLFYPLSSQILCFLIGVFALGGHDSLAARTGRT